MTWDNIYYDVMKKIWANSLVLRKDFPQFVSRLNLLVNNIIYEKIEQHDKMKNSDKSERGQRRKILYQLQYIV